MMLTTLSAYSLICSDPSSRARSQSSYLVPLHFFFFFFFCSFLYDPNSQGYRYYRQKLDEFRKAKAGSTGSFPAPAPNPSLRRKSAPEALSGAVPPITACPTPVAPAPAVNPTPSIPGKPTATAAVKRKRKSRWGPEEDKVELPPAELAQRDIDASPSPLSGVGPFLGGPRGYLRAWATFYSLLWLGTLGYLCIDI
jgi:hypothetical protein